MFSNCFMIYLIFSTLYLTLKNYPFAKNNDKKLLFKDLEWLNRAIIQKKSYFIDYKRIWSFQPLKTPLYYKNDEKLLFRAWNSLKVQLFKIKISSLIIKESFSFDLSKPPLYWKNYKKLIFKRLECFYEAILN